MSASLDERSTGFLQDAPASISTNVYALLAINVYGYSSAATNLGLNIIGDLDMYALHTNIGRKYTIVAGPGTPAYSLGAFTEFGLLSRNGIRISQASGN